eukprot:gnl/TRDRNA2_/TRDRNA2_94078_c0_seq1.p1 gnl/TRDRNA2_/TRDRNA2_94078_c0~~gnl/TRDRNA2_/TRDRNA2_94078_c0_seq1.p1  ORF type:complete len:411 (-),score=52.39 gnl/TRDRNA2_/TRDRNA2_94078_c0_seq1:38-1270(-)
MIRRCRPSFSMMKGVTAALMMLHGTLASDCQRSEGGCCTDNVDEVAFLQARKSRPISRLHARLQMRDESPTNAIFHVPSFGDEEQHPKGKVQRELQKTKTEDQALRVQRELHKTKTEDQALRVQRELHKTKTEDQALRRRLAHVEAAYRRDERELKGSAKGAAAVPQAYEGTQRTQEEENEDTRRLLEKVYREESEGGFQDARKMKEHAADMAKNFRWTLRHSDADGSHTVTSSTTTTDVMPDSVWHHDKYVPGHGAFNQSSDFRLRCNATQYCVPGANWTYPPQVAYGLCGSFGTKVYGEGLLEWQQVDFWEKSKYQAAGYVDPVAITIFNRFHHPTHEIQMCEPRYSFGIDQVGYSLQELPSSYGYTMEEFETAYPALTNLSNGLIQYGCQCSDHPPGRNTRLRYAGR